VTLQVKAWLSFLLVALMAYTGYSAWGWYQSAQVRRDGASKPRHIEQTRATGSLADAALVDTEGKPFSLDDLKGHVWLASFFFSSCPGPCAQMNREISSLQQEITDPSLKFVSITCDPANDTPEVLAKYARTFQADPARWSFLSGPFASVKKLGTEAFQVPVGPKMHTERVILIDKWSNVRGLYLTSDPTQMITLKKKIKQLTAEETPPDVPDKEEADTLTVEGAVRVDDSAAHDQAASKAEESAPTGPEPSASSFPAVEESTAPAAAEGTP